jgi:fumarate hydratase subunit alpha
MDTIREIPCSMITDTVCGLFIEANTDLVADVQSALEKSAGSERSEIGRYVLGQIIENVRIARAEAMPICQDTGLAVLFVEIGQDVHIVGGNFYDALQEGVRRAYKEGYFRKSICDPLSRRNTGDNTPAVIHTEICEGSRIRIIAMPKGGGSENMSSSVMLTPAAGIEGIKRHVVEQVVKAGPNPCPPTIIGVGIGGSLEQSAILAKKALVRAIGERNERDERLALMEEELLEEINCSGIGPQGYGGTTTALDVHIEMMPCHIASLPVTVNIQCHVARHREAII